MNKAEPNWFPGTVGTHFAGEPTKPTPTAHCEDCGTDNPKAFDGYTSCCNELICYGGVKADGYDSQGRRMSEYRHEANCRKVTR